MHGTSEDLGLHVQRFRVFHLYPLKTRYLVSLTDRNFSRTSSTFPPCTVARLPPGHHVSAIHEHPLPPFACVVNQKFDIIRLKIIIPAIPEHFSYPGSLIFHRVQIILRPDFNKHPVAFSVSDYPFSPSSPKFNNSQQINFRHKH